jgi:hypothetical protein
MFWDPCYGRATLNRLIHVVTDVIEDNDFQLSTEMEHLLTSKTDKLNCNYVTKLGKRPKMSISYQFSIDAYFAHFNINHVNHTFQIIFYDK